LVLLGLLTAAAGRRPDAGGPLSGIDEAWELLVASERRSSTVADELLLLPETGRWLRHCLQRLQEPPRPREDDEPPLWVDVGHLHLLAAVAAVRTGLSFSLQVPARYGRIWFPTLGCASVRGEVTSWQVADALYEAGTLSVGLSGDAGKGQDPVLVRSAESRSDTDWHEPRFVSVDLPDGPRRILFHDLGPYRMQPDTERLAFAATSEGELGRWRDLLQRAWPLLARVDPRAAEDVSSCLRSIEPLPPALPFRWYSATMEDGMGGMAASEPTGAEPAAAAQFASILTHEIQHSKLSALLHMYSLHAPDASRGLYAPWRDDPRPLRGMLHGVYAFTGVARFWRGYVLNGCPAEEEALASFEFALRRCQLLRVLPRLNEDERLTDLGRRVVGRLLEVVEQWQGEQVRADSLEQAARAADDHWMSWRAHHFLPDARFVAALADEWANGDLDPATVTHGWAYPEPELRTDPTARHLDARAVLMRVRMMRSTARELSVRGGVEGLVRGARRGDLHLLSGNNDSAQRLYTADIAGVPLPAHAPGVVWAGLGLALEGRSDRTWAARALSVFPELVRHVYAAIGTGDESRPDPAAVADWLGRTVTPIPRA
jgi:HEXXH motif-containing protein